MSQGERSAEGTTSEVAGLRARLAACEARLGQAEQGFSDLFENMNEGFALHEIILDGDGRPVDYRFLGVNRAFARLTGLTPALVVGRTALEVIPMLEPEFIERYGRVALTGEPARFELRADGLGRTFHVSAYRPEPLRFGCIFTDVTEQRHAEAALRRAVTRAESSEQSLRMVAEQSRDVIWTYDLDAQRFTYVSPSVFALRGFTPEEALAQPLAEALTPESLARGQAAIAQMAASAGGEPHVAIYDQRCKDGSVKHVEMTVSLLRDEAGRARTTLGISRDATDRVRAEEALRQSETLYRSLFSASPSGVLLVNSEGRLLTFNDRAAAQLGYTREEYGRLALWQIDAEDDQDRVRARLEQVDREGQVEFDTRHRARDGSLHEVHVRVVKVELGGKIAMLSTVDDLTELRRLNRELQQGLAERDERERWLQASQRVARIGHYVFEITEDRWTSSPVLDELFGIGPIHRRTAETWLSLVHPDDAFGPSRAAGQRLPSTGSTGWAGRAAGALVHGLGT
jgi:PAS domain S-box-containing protein